MAGAGTAVKKIKSSGVNPLRYPKSIQESFLPLIEGKISKLEIQIKSLNGSLSSNAGDRTPDSLDQAINAVTREKITTEIGRQERLKKNLENAKLRIQNGIFGTCRKTGQLIPVGRLKLVPHATLTVEYKNNRDK